MTQYSMIPITSGTRMRADHNTFSSVIASYARGQLIVGDEIWEAPTDGIEVRKGDKWLKVLSVDEVSVPIRGWMALIHKTIHICDNFKVLTTPDPTPDPTTPPVPIPQEEIMEDFTMITHGGKRAYYKFIRFLEEGEIV